jgi:hypothetical protein
LICVLQEILSVLDTEGCFVVSNIYAEVILAKDLFLRYNHYGPDRLWVHPDCAVSCGMALSAGIKRPEREADYSYSICADVKNTSFFTFFTPYTFS